MQTEKIRKNFSKYVLLNVLGMIGLSCYILADTYFVSKALGTNGLAALNLAISIYSVIHASGLMLGIGGATNFSILKAQGKTKEGNISYTHTILLGMMLGLLFLIIGIFFSSGLARLLGANADTFELISVYLRVILCFSPFFILNNILLAFIRNDGNPRLAMTAMLAGCLSNILLDYLFMFPFSMGMFGAAFATGIAPVIGISISLTHIFKRKNSFHIVINKVLLKVILRILSLGLSSFIVEISSGIVLIVFNLVILTLEGNLGLAAYGIVANLALVFLSIFTGVAQGIQPLVSNSFGTGAKQDLSYIKKKSIRLILLLSILIYTISNLFSDRIISIFNSEEIQELIPLTTRGFRIYFLGFLVAGYNIIAAAFLSAITKTTHSFLISVLRGIVTILPLVFLLPQLFDMNGVWISFPLAEAFTFILSLRYWSKGSPVAVKRKSNV